MSPHETLGLLAAGGALSEAQAEVVFEGILSGGFDDVQIAGLLSLIQGRGVTVGELVGAAKVMRRHVTRVPIPQGPAGVRTVVIDTCGTGGGTKTFNVSTAAALVVAGASPHLTGGKVRLLVAKHGNRSRTGRGSAEVLAALGVNVDAGPEVQGRCLREAGVCFCFAIHHHPATRHAGAARKSLGFPTMFNLLGPLANPAGAECQVIGTYRPEFVDLLAGALAGLGTRRAMVVHGHSGMDEISTTGATRVAHVRDGAVSIEELSPGGIGVAATSLSQLVAGDIEHAAAMIRGVVSGERGPARDIVVVNAAAALMVAGVEGEWGAAVTRAGEAIDSGRAGEALRLLVAGSR